MRVFVVLLAAVALAASGCANPFSKTGERRNQETGPGGLALDYIGKAHPKVLVEIDAVNGAGPNESALADFRTVISDALGKPVTIDVSATVEGRGATHAYSLAEINALELKHRDRYTGGDTAVLYVLYLDGSFESPGVLAVAYHGSSVAMMKGTIRANSRDDAQVLPTPSTLTRPREHFVERAVLAHEFGHNLGLVNNGIPMVKPHEERRDPNSKTPENEGEKHSSNRASVMYWAVETTEITNVFTNGEDIPWRFDADDKADIRNAKETER